MRRIWRAALGAAWLGLVATAAAQPAGSIPLLLGMTVALSGPQAAFGIGLQHGAELAVARVNAEGGIGGRPVRLAVLDDRGDARSAAANTRNLLGQGAIALVGGLGAESVAATAEALLDPQGKAAVAALVGPASGAEGLREPPRPGVYHLRAGLAEEASAGMLHLDTIGVSRFAILTQDSSLGQAGRVRLVHELARIALQPVAAVHLPPVPGPRDLQAALDTVCAASPQVLLLALDSASVGALVPLAKARRCSAQFMAFSEAGTALARPAGSPETSAHPLGGLLVTQIVPHPGARSHPLIASYRQALGADGVSQASHASVEGYQAARVALAALAVCGREPTRSCVLRTLSGSRLEVAGSTLQFGPAQRVARPFVEVSLLDAQGRFLR